MHDDLTGKSIGLVQVSSFHGFRENNFFFMRYLLLIVSLVVIGFTTVVSIPGSLYLIG